MRQQAIAKRKERDDKHIKIPEVPSETQHFILSLTAEELVSAIKSGQVSCVDATATYMSRAYSIGRDLELTAEEPFEEALSLARDRDRQLKESPETCGRLHGLPMSIKDQFQQRGCHSGCGVVHKAMIPDEEDACLLYTSDAADE